MEQSAADEVDMVNRDPNNLNDHVKVSLHTIMQNTYKYITFNSY